MTKNILVVENILSANDRIAAENRAIFDASGIKAFNLMASPGAGKTSLIEQTLKRLLPTMNMAVIDGDIATNLDADRAEAAGAVAVEECGSQFLQSIQGSHSGLIGLPMFELRQALTKCGFFNT